jgi:hypothetical protein
MSRQRDFRAGPAEGRAPPAPVPLRWAVPTRLAPRRAALGRAPGRTVATPRSRSMGSLHLGALGVVAQPRLRHRGAPRSAPPAARSRGLPARSAAPRPRLTPSATRRASRPRRLLRASPGARTARAPRAATPRSAPPRRAPRSPRSSRRVGTRRRSRSGAGTGLRRPRSGEQHDEKTEKSASRSG